MLAKAREVFPSWELSDLMALLDSYGTEEHEGEKERVQLAILKLCDEDNLDDPSRYVDAAKRDYRDVLAWAEYPNQMKADPLGELPPSDHRNIVELDKRQYEEWLGASTDEA